MSRATVDPYAFPPHERCHACARNIRNTGVEPRSAQTLHHRPRGLPGLPRVPPHRRRVAAQLPRPLPQRDAQDLHRDGRPRFDRAGPPRAPGTLVRLEQGGKILDVGAGGGYHAAHYAGRFSNAKVVALEMDGPSLDLARKTVAEAGLAGRVEIRPGEANQLDDSDEYGLVMLNRAPRDGQPTRTRELARASCAG